MRQVLGLIPTTEKEICRTTRSDQMLKLHAAQDIHSMALGVDAAIPPLDLTHSFSLMKMLPASGSELSSS